MTNLEQFRRAMYKGQRGIGTYQTARRGGAPAVGKRLARRALMRGVIGPGLSRLFR